MLVISPLAASFGALFASILPTLKFLFLLSKTGAGVVAEKYHHIK